MSYIRAYEIHLFKFFHSSLVTPSLRAMSKLQLSTIAIEQLAKVLPLQLRAAQQHFIHILILDCWAAAAGGTSSSLSRGITDIDEVDLPNAMRIIDLMVESKNTPEIGFPKSDLMVAARELQNRQVPSPGEGHKGIFSEERTLEKQLTQVLETAKRTLEPKEDWDRVAHLITIPLGARRNFQTWIQSVEKAGFPTDHPKLPLGGEALRSLNHYFRHLVITINQTLIHCFVHWHQGSPVLADATWAASSNAMMLARNITLLLAERGLSPAPLPSAPSNPLPQNIAGTSDTALKHDQLLAEATGRAAQQAAGMIKEIVEEVPFKSECEKASNYFQLMQNWSPNQPLPQLENPCIGFQRVLNQYVY